MLISTSGTAVVSTVTPTAIVDGCPTLISIGRGQMCADAGATVSPRIAAVAAAVTSARTADRRTGAHAIAGAAPSRPASRETNRYAAVVRIRLLVPLSVSLALVLAACGGSSKPSSSSPTTPQGPTTTVHVAKVASARPSISAKMICETEAQNDIYDS